MGCNCGNKKRTVWTYRNARRAAQGGADQTTAETEPTVASAAEDASSKGETEPREAN